MRTPTRYLAVLLTVLLFPCALLWIQGQTSTGDDGDDAVLLRLGGREVMRSDFVRAHGGREAVRAMSKADREEALQRFVDFYLLVQEAERMQLDTLPEVRGALLGRRQALLRQWFEQIAPSGAGDPAPSSAPSGDHTDLLLLSRITLRLPQHAPAGATEAARARMDSLYQALRQGAAFEVLARRFSAVPTASWMRAAEMTSEMEGVAYSQPQGQVSAPFWDPEGVHIVRVIDRRPSTAIHAASPSSSALSAAPPDAFLSRLKQIYAYAPRQAAIDELLARGSTSQVLFTLGGKGGEAAEAVTSGRDTDSVAPTTYDGQRFALYAQGHPQSVRRQFDGFVRKSVLDYAARAATTPGGPLARAIEAERDSLLYRTLIREFLAARLTPARLQTYFAEHQADYRYASTRYRGTVVHARTKRALKQAKKFLRDLPPEEHEQAISLVFRDSLSPEVVVEQGFFSPGENPFVDQLAFGHGKAQPLTGHPYTLLLGQKVRGPQDYSEVLPQVSADCARALEQQWLQLLRERTPVEINAAALDAKRR